MARERFAWTEERKSGARLHHARVSQLGRVCRRVKLVRATSQPTPTCVPLRRVASRRFSSRIIFGASSRRGKRRDFPEESHLGTNCTAQTRASRPRPAAAHFLQFVSLRRILGFARRFAAY